MRRSRPGRSPLHAEEGSLMMLMQRWLPLQRASAIVVASCACLLMSALVPRPAGAASLDGVPGFGHAFLIVGENTSIKQVTPKRAPYLTGTLIPQGAWLTHYAALTDGSLGDYAAMVSGQFVRCES